MRRHYFIAKLQDSDPMRDRLLFAGPYNLTQVVDEVDSLTSRSVGEYVEDHGWMPAYAAGTRERVVVTTRRMVNDGAYIWLTDQFPMRIYGKARWFDRFGEFWFVTGIGVAYFVAMAFVFRWFFT